MWLIEHSGEQVVFGPSTEVKSDTVSVTDSSAASSSGHNHVIRVGRAEECEICLSNENTISRTHCEIRWNRENDSLTVRDTSTYGTTLNGRKLRKKSMRVLKDGDTLSLGGGRVELRARKLAIVACLSGLGSSKKKSRITQQLQSMGISVSGTFNESVTHLLVSSEVEITEKVVLSVVYDRPVVTPSWLDRIMKTSRWVGSAKGYEEFAPGIIKDGTRFRKKKSDLRASLYRSHHCIFTDHIVFNHNRRIVESVGGRAWLLDISDIGSENGKTKWKHLIESKLMIVTNEDPNAKLAFFHAFETSEFSMIRSLRKKLVRCGVSDLVGLVHSASIADSILFCDVNGHPNSKIPWVSVSSVIGIPERRSKKRVLSEVEESEILESTLELPAMIDAEHATKETSQSSSVSTDPSSMASSDQSCSSLAVKRRRKKKTSNVMCSSNNGKEQSVILSGSLPSSESLMNDGKPTVKKKTRHESRDSFSMQGLQNSLDRSVSSADPSPPDSPDMKVVRSLKNQQRQKEGSIRKPSMKSTGLFNGQSSSPLGSNRSTTNTERLLNILVDSDDEDDEQGDHSEDASTHHHSNQSAPVSPPRKTVDGWINVRGKRESCTKSRYYRKSSSLSSKKKRTILVHIDEMESDPNQEVWNEYRQSGQIHFPEKVPQKSKSSGMKDDGNPMVEIEFEDQIVRVKCPKNQRVYQLPGKQPPPPKNLRPLDIPAEAWDQPNFKAFRKHHRQQSSVKLPDYVSQSKSAKWNLTQYDSDGGIIPDLDDENRRKKRKRERKKKRDKGGRKNEKKNGHSNDSDDDEGDEQDQLTKEERHDREMERIRSEYLRMEQREMEQSQRMDELFEGL